MKVQWLYSTLPAWRRSVALGLPSHIILLMGVTFFGWLKAVRQFWWLLLVVGGIGWLTRWLLVLTASYSMVLWVVAGFALAALHAVVMLMLVGIFRPSVAEKKFAYFVWILRKNYVVAMVIGWGSLLLASLTSSFYVTLAIGSFSGDLIYWPLAWWYSSPFIIFYMLFSIDGVGRSWWRAFLMTWYDYPACFVMVLLMVGINRLFSIIGDSWWALPADAVMIGNSIQYLVVIPLAIQLLVNLYSKRVHEHYEEYFS